ncbi:hypothetical protein BpHYR1_001743 [Brachionus plicatilis]|uniref:Uncharacterized protein n=1 Tax=Brachionus plicatilis TaxID=10195 RepID=A0A3M7RCA7_BRAPC|nr:hypothetical protein BpHYR1_001743 [Brachionus plicatilis]
MNFTYQDHNFDDCEQKKEKKLKNGKVDENINLFCKHYKISKREDLKVKFDSKLNTEIFIDEENNSIETIEKEKELIENFQTYEQIDAKIDELLSQLKELPKRKIEEGYDVSYELDLIKHQAFILNKQKENIEKREREIEKENKYRKIEMEISIRKEQGTLITETIQNVTIIHYY